MRHWILVFLVIMTAAAEAKGFGGISFGTQIENRRPGEPEPHMWEINYDVRTDYFSAYGGYLVYDAPVRPEFRRFNNEVFETSGLQAGIRIHPDMETIRPFIGLGLYSTFDNDCYADFFGNSFCENQGFIAVFPEAGVQFDLGKNLVIMAKVRYYDFDLIDIQPESVSAINVAFYF